ncbi:MAG: single-stranded DNA-binding protein [Treponema sp.]|nr:single-stranded DNA-binding protein [Treponema sp.]
MNQLNSVIVEGNVTKQPSLREPVPGFKVAEFTIGVNRFYKDKNGEGKEEVSYIPIQTMNKLAEYASEKCSKGRGIRVVGRLKQDRWKNSEDKWESRMMVVAEHVEYKPKFESKETATKADTVAAMKLAEQAASDSEIMADSEIEAVF